MAPRNIKAKAYMLSQMHKLENTPEDQQDPDEYTSLTIITILRRIEDAKVKSHNVTTPYVPFSEGLSQLRG